MGNKESRGLMKFEVFGARASVKLVLHLPTDRLREHGSEESRGSMNFEARGGRCLSGRNHIRPSCVLFVLFLRRVVAFFRNRCLLFPCPSRCFCSHFSPRLGAARVLLDRCSIPKHRRTNGSPTGHTGRNWRFEHGRDVAETSNLRRTALPTVFPRLFRCRIIFLLSAVFLSENPAQSPPFLIIFPPSAFLHADVDPF